MDSSTMCCDAAGPRRVQATEEEEETESEREGGGIPYDQYIQYRSSKVPQVMITVQRDFLGLLHTLSLSHSHTQSQWPGETL